MFNLEQSITEWRKQMLAAGVKTPVPLEELEIHLREEIERQIKSGENNPCAFEIAIAKTGQPQTLKTEFAKIRVPVAWRVLAVLWFAGCFWSLDTICRQFALNQLPQNRQLFLFNALAWFIYAAGLPGSLLLFRGSKWGISVIRMMALFFFIICLAQCLPVFHAPLKWRMWCGICALFSAVSIWLLQSQKKLKTAA